MPAPDRDDLQLGMQRPDSVSDGRLKAGNASRGGLLAREVLVLRTRWQRAFQAFGRNLSDQRGLLLLGAPIQAVHALGARHDLRLLFLNQDGRLLQSGILPRWRSLLAPEGCVAALFLDARNRAEIDVGDKVEWIKNQPRLDDRAEWLVDGKPPESAPPEDSEA